jgi:hypothetical protein
LTAATGAAIITRLTNSNCHGSSGVPNHHHLHLQRRRRLQQPEGFRIQNLELLLL